MKPSSDIDMYSRIGPLIVVSRLARPAGGGSAR
jgi:hypothetical protein